MRKLVVFNQISLDGYIMDANGDMSWAKEGNDDEFNAFTSENAKGGGVLLFGRVTYDLMAGFWTTPQAFAALPIVAERMNSLPKVVFSRTMDKAEWDNTQVVRSEIVAAIRSMKAEPGPGMALMGSGTIVSQLANTDVIDEYQVVVNPLILGAGRTMFEHIKDRINLDLVSFKKFRNGKIYLNYTPKLRA